MRKSKQQELVRSLALGSYCHPTAADIYAAARETDPSISLGTVYRNLDKLVSDGLLDKFVVPGSPDHYDATQTEHYHVQCQHCGQIFDVELRIARNIARAIHQQTGVKMQSLQIIASGVCQKCRAQEKGG